MAAAGEAHPAGRPAPRRAGRRLRRQLLPRRDRGVQRREPAAVHALRHLPDGDLLQQGPRRLRPDGAPGPRRTRRGRGGRGPADLELRPVRRRRRLRHPPAPRHQGRVRRSHARGTGAVHLLRRRPDVRRRERSEVAGVLRRRHEGRAGALTGAVPQPHPHPERGPARGAHAPAVVQARQARDARRLPRAGPRPASRAGPGLRRDRDAEPRDAPPRSDRSPACACPRTPPAPPPPPTSWSTCSTPPPPPTSPTPATSCPANIEVAVSDDFLQPGRLPITAQVFNASVRNIVFPPLLSTWPELEAAVTDDLDRLFNQPILDNLDELTEQIDEDSRTVLDPESVSPSASESDSAS